MCRLAQHQVDSPAGDAWSEPMRCSVVGNLRDAAQQAQQDNSSALVLGPVREVVGGWVCHACKQPTVHHPHFSRLQHTLPCKAIPHTLGPQSAMQSGSTVVAALSAE